MAGKTPIVSLDGLLLCGKLFISKEKIENDDIIVKKKTPTTLEYLEGDSTIYDYLQMVGL